MEPITLTATLIAALLAGAATGAGEATITELSNVIRERFRKEGKENLLDQAAEEPKVIQAELIDQMKDDQEYQNRLEKSLESLGLTQHVILSDLETQGGIKLQDISLKDYGSHLLSTKLLSNLTAVQDIEVSGAHFEFQKKTLR
ncbi:hypothetical protein H6G64_33205 [Calothrix sp. FACHB-156]|nr:hypothetical protein [Calothrix sp. FACHB-156]